MLGGVTPAGKLDADAVKRYADLGVRRLIVSRLAHSEAEVLGAVERVAALQARCGA